MITTWLLGAWLSEALAPALCLRRPPRLAGDLPELALTFDDGPDPGYTPQVLAILEHYGVKASFFMVGSKVRRHPDIARAVADAGHDLGNHSDRHHYPWFQLPHTAYHDYLQANTSIAAAAGRAALFARAPWGVPNLGLWLAMRRQGQVYVHWSVHGYDWRPGISGAAIRRRVLAGAGPGGVVLLHDGAGYPGDPRALVEALPNLIESLQQRFQLVPLRRWIARNKEEESAPHVDSLGLGSI